MIIAHISDPHVTLEEESSDSFERALAHLMRLPARPDLVLITGDCTEHGTIEEYRRVRGLLDILPIPAFVIPGNHDKREQMGEVFGDQGAQRLPGFMQYVVDAGDLRLIALDTNIPGSGGGELCSTRLAWLEERLAEAPERPTLIAMHHPPFLTGLKPLDQIGLAQADAFGALIARHQQVERILAGHIHTTMVRRFYGTIAMTSPATAMQAFPDLRPLERLAIIQEPPACLLHVWSANTGLITHTSLIGSYGPARTIHDGTKWL